MSEVCIIDPKNPEYDVPSLSPESRDTRKVRHWFIRKAALALQSGQDVRYLLNDPNLSESNAKQRLKTAAKTAGVEVYITKHDNYVQTKFYGGNWG